jgi:hypothetical protein
MKTSHIIIAIVIIIIIFLYWKKSNSKKVDTASVTPKSTDPVQSIVEPVHSISAVDASNNSGVSVSEYEGKHIKGSMPEQYIVQDGKKLSLTYDDWKKRGFDPFVEVSDDVINAIAHGGLYSEINK